MQCDRREFIRLAAGLPAGLALAAGAMAGEAAPGGKAKGLPQIQIGGHTISRLVCGGNPFNAGSHLSTFVNQAMREYYTPEQILKTLAACEAAGIRAWQSISANLELYRRHVELGGTLKFLSLEKSDSPAIPDLAKAGCIAVAHHGEETDKMFRAGGAGALAPVGDFLKRVHDAGLAAGVSTHIPEVVDAIESKGWEVDYYMTCVYRRHRSEEELKALLGRVPLPVGEVYLKEDPPRMFESMRQTKRPCLAFKILAAGRLCDKKPLVEAAFRETYAAIKPGDGVIVGIYDKYSNQAAEDAGFVRKYGI